MLLAIIYFSFLIAIVVFFIYHLYSYYKSCKEEEKEQEDFIKSLTPGSEWVLRKEPSMNPFYHYNSDTIVVIVETRKNFYGDIWVRYKFKHLEYLHAKEAANFKELYKKLN